MGATKISMNQVKNLVNYAIDNNMKLEEAGVTPIAISLEASAGIGKTSIIRQIAKERNMSFTKINMAQLEETGDLIGMPIVEYECQMGQSVKTESGEIKTKLIPGTAWLTNEQLRQPSGSIKYRRTGKSRMGYAKPSWVPEYSESGNIVLMDDYVRAAPQLLQACMDLILEQKYISWSLPKKTSIVLTNNPDDGESNVNSLDEAQRTRFLNYEVTFDTDAWAQWAEKAGIDGRCINFVLNYSDSLFEADEQGNRICNPRSFVMFTNMISGIDDWDTPESLNFINIIAKGCFKDEQGRFASMFDAFLRAKIHKLIPPKKLLSGKWEEVKEMLENTVYDSDGEYRPDIAAVLERRFSNYICAWLDSPEKTPIATVRDRILDILKNTENGGKTLFAPDLVYHIVNFTTICINNS